MTLQTASCGIFPFAQAVIFNSPIWSTPFSSHSQLFENAAFRLQSFETEWDGWYRACQCSQLNQDLVCKVDSANLQGHHSLQKGVQLLTTIQITSVSTLTEATYNTAPISRENMVQSSWAETHQGTNSRDSPSKGTHLELLSAAVSH